MGKIKKSILFVIIVIIPILAVDYYVDSYASFRVTYNKIGQVSNKSNYCIGTDIPLSERKIKWAHVNLMDSVENMVLGSSRMMLLSSDDIGKTSFYNMAVSGGCTVNDYMAETYILYNQGKLPKQMLIEISPSIFNANSWENRWKEWGASTVYMENILNGKEEVSDDSFLLGIQVKDIFSPSYFKYNLEQLKKEKRVWFIENNMSDDQNYATWHVDGSYMYSREYQNHYTEDEILEKTIEECNSKNIYQCNDYHELDSELMSRFESLVDFLGEEGVEISFYLPPYSKDMYEYICTDEYYNSILAVEEYILEYSTEKGYTLYGSYNPEMSRLQLSDLYDVYHVKKQKIADTMWTREKV